MPQGEEVKTNKRLKDCSDIIEETIDAIVTP